MIFLRNLFIGLLLLLVAMSVLLVVTREGRATIATALLLPEVLPNVPVQPLERFTAAPLEERVRFPYSGGTGNGVLYRPDDDNQHGAIIMFLGINPDMEDATLHRFARALAREGVVVLVAAPASLHEGLLTLQEVDLLVGAFSYLRDAAYTDPDRIGFVGYCVGSSVSLLAAADPRISSQVKFVNFFAGYYSARSLLSAMTTHQIAVGDAVEVWEPNADAYLWLLQQLGAALTSQEELELLAAAASRGTPLSASELTVLSAEARAVHNIVANSDPAQYDALYRALPQSLRERFERLSLNGSLERLEAQIFIMHDRNDTYIPHTESRKLLEALAGYPDKHYTEFSLFKHMHPDASAEGSELLREVSKLYYHLYLVMREVV